MNPEQIKHLLETGMLRKRSPDMKQADTLIDAANERASIAKAIPLSEKSATTILSELYESFKNLGNARWWVLGYKPTKDAHVVSMLIISKAQIAHAYKVQNIDRFRQLRNKANYDGYRVTLGEAKEILGLWNEVSEELIEWVKEKRSGNKVEKSVEKETK